jgi:hypothetical protein
MLCSYRNLEAKPAVERPQVYLYQENNSLLQIVKVDGAKQVDQID